MTNNEYRKLITDTRLTCLCTEEEAKRIVSMCTRLNADPVKFIAELPRLMGTVNPKAEDVIKEMERIAAEHDVRVDDSVILPAGFVNRAERRRRQKELQRK